jgi:hypothetical protein
MNVNAIRLVRVVNRGWLAAGCARNFTGAPHYLVSHRAAAFAAIEEAFAS